MHSGRVGHSGGPPNFSGVGDLGEIGDGLQVVLVRRLLRHDERVDAVRRRRCREREALGLGTRLRVVERRREVVRRRAAEERVERADELGDEIELAVAPARAGTPRGRRSPSCTTRSRRPSATPGRTAARRTRTRRSSRFRPRTFPWPSCRTAAGCCRSGTSRRRPRGSARRSKPTRPPSGPLPSSTSC